MLQVLKIIFLIFFIHCEALTQSIVWKHLGGPMGGIVGDIAINSKSEIFAGVYPYWTAEYSGLYKSTDNGNTWSKIVTQFNDFQVYAIYITEEDHIWVGTNFQGRIYRSTDNGKTWENKRNGYNTGECWAFGQSKDGILFAGDGQYVKIFRSTDYGENWTLSANLRPLVFATDSNNIVYAGTHDGLFATRDSGKTWAQNNFLKNFPVSSLLIDTNNNIFCGTGYYSNGDGVFHSADGGQNWTQLGLTGKVVLSLAFDSQNNLYAGTLNDGLFKTTDMGQTWNQYQNGLYRKQVFRLKLNKKNDIFIGSENEGVFRSTNGGNSFEQIGLPISKVKNILFSGDSLIFTSTPSGVQKYNRVMKKWSNLGLQNVEAIAITPSIYIYAGTLDEGLYKSTDLGNTWVLTNLTIDSLMSVYNVLAVNDDTIFVSTEFNLRRSTNCGKNWEVLPIRTGFFSRGLLLDNNILWCTGYGINKRSLYRSTDLGVTFDTVFTGFLLSDENNPISTTNDGYVFIADPVQNSFRGIIRSTNHGSTWDQVLFNKYTYTVFVKENGMVITGGLSITGDDSVYLSADHGESWASILQPIGSRNYITDIKEDISGDFFFATYRTGLYEVDIITDVKEYPEIIPRIFYLFQNYPNPFNPSTVISYQLSAVSHVTLKVFDILGREVATLVNEEKSPGHYSVNFEGTNLSSGIYFYELKADEIRLNKKMVLLR
jgi:photosystem II stability/assembly factor-like uncharacterized protein